jgi:hypothetical protein
MQGAEGGQTISPLWMRAGFIERVEVIISGDVALFSFFSRPTRRLTPSGVIPERSNGRPFRETWIQAKIYCLFLNSSSTPYLVACKNQRPDNSYSRSWVWHCFHIVTNSILFNKCWKHFKCTKEQLAVTPKTTCQVN